jgi:hypothetical protein
VRNFNEDEAEHVRIGASEKFRVCVCEVSRANPFSIPLIERTSHKGALRSLMTRGWILCTALCSRFGSLRVGSMRIPSALRSHKAREPSEGRTNHNNSKANFQLRMQLPLPLLSLPLPLPTSMRWYERVTEKFSHSSFVTRLVFYAMRKT